MYRLLDRHLNANTTTASQTSTSTGHESTSVIVFKCSNRESKLLVDTIRNTLGRTPKNIRRLVENHSLFSVQFSSICSARSDARSTIDRTGGMPFYDPQQPPQHLPHDHSTMIRKFHRSSTFDVFFSLQDPTYAAGPQHSSRSVTQQQSTTVSADHYRHLTEELNKCFDDIELFVRYLESLVEYTKELDRDHRRKDKKSTGLSSLRYSSNSFPLFFF